MMGEAALEVARILAEYQAQIAKLTEETIRRLAALGVEDAPRLLARNTG
jgi:hypothetical protein